MQAKTQRLAMKERVEKMQCGSPPHFTSRQKTLGEMQWEKKSLAKNQLSKCTQRQYLEQVDKPNSKTLYD